MMFDTQEEYNTLFGYYLSNIYLSLKLFTHDFTNKKHFLTFMIMIFGFYLLKIGLFVNEKEEMKVWIFLVCFIIMNDIISHFDVDSCSF